MKNIFKLGLFALLFTVGACNDATDIIQESELDETAAFQTVADLNSGLNGVYSAYSPDAGSNGNGDAIFFNDLFTDNIKKGLVSSGQGSSEYSFILQPSTSTPESIWANRYGTINRANRVLRAFERIYPTLPAGDVAATNEDQFAADKIKGQLLAIRALCHLDLFEYFTPDYANAAGLSVIKMDFVPEVTDTFERNTVSEIVAFINDDMDQAATLLDGFTVGAAFNSWHYMSVNAVKAMQARLALDTENYVLAETIATDLMSTGSLADAAAYQDMFTDTAQGEIIFSLARNPNTGDNGIAGNWYANRVRRTGSPVLEASKQLYNLFDDADVRKAVTFVAVGDPEGSAPNAPAPAYNGIILIGKYPGAAADFLVNDVKIFRYSEIQLILAEAQARNNNLAGAASSIAALRTKRNDPTATPAYASVNAALTDVLLERRKELAFEGHRYLDLKRLGGELGIGISRLASDAATFAAPTDLAANDYRFTLPIPQSELNANSIITQNPGYPVN
ncbi:MULTISPECIES: RagB/SusD family nutrient uptake outer membrane protein [unclassified Flavobacterium]|uniref:RagB/SusD family nutrient uptake outer membrane protein n=1 Tax=unclassified Flavobacterium TaxID=196869 RepID=UPI0025C6C412|nr:MULTISPECIES: RagB/SusD family nutrient uptake outer membrane protein [unclassified Flavobacterium]